MRLAVPSETDAGLASVRSGHFGHAAYYTIVEFDDQMRIAGVRSLPNADHDAVGCMGIVRHVLDQDVQAILTAGMGMRPMTAFEQNGVAVYREGRTPLVGDAVAKFARGECERMDPSQACNHRH